MAPLPHTSWLISALLPLAFFITPITANGRGTTTRYWDCCKPSCSWSNKAPVSQPVNTCNAANNQYLQNPDATSGCEGGEAFQCSDQAPWAVRNNLAFGFAAAKLAGQSESDWCCACYALTFTTTSIAGKTLVVQITNTGGDLGDNHFDIAMPGGGVGQFNGCSQQWGGGIDLGQQYGGFSDVSQCGRIPGPWQDSCAWRFDWFENADNPEVQFRRVRCPRAKSFQFLARVTVMLNGEYLRSSLA
ncbi:Glycoside hydrolase family 45 [Neofusicoccum parvum]|nr:Glycoside hydrolase family 45 [Neofusicoccum parvum]